MKIALSPRLEEALKMLPTPSVVYDVGADHGFFSLACVSKGDKVYAGENKKGPYQSLCKNLKEFPQYPVTPVFADGLDLLPDEVNTVSLLGMGGKTISEILLKDPKKLRHVDTILVEPQSQVTLTIAALEELGYKNDEGKYVFEKRYYPLLRFRKGKKQLSPLERKYGEVPVKRKDPLLREYLKRQLSYLLPFPEEKEKAESLEEDLIAIYGEEER